MKHRLAALFNWSGILAACLLVGAWGALAQEVTGSIRGVVTDPRGRVFDRTDSCASTLNVFGCLCVVVAALMLFLKGKGLAALR